MKQPTNKDTIMQSSKVLYSEQDNVDLNNTISDFQPQVINVNNNDLYESIKRVFNEGQSVKREEKYFTPFSSKYIYNIDNTIFSPNTLVMLSGKRFDEKYLKQLESIIFTDKEELNTDQLFSLVYLFSFINKKQYPIKITSSKFIRMLPNVVNGLNFFFNKNYSVVYSIYTMFTSIKDTEKEAAEANAKELTKKDIEYKMAVDALSKYPLPTTSYYLEEE